MHHKWCDFICSIFRVEVGGQRVRGRNAPWTGQHFITTHRLLFVCFHVSFPSGFWSKNYLVLLWTLANLHTAEILHTRYLPDTERGWENYRQSSEIHFVTSPPKVQCSWDYLLMLRVPIGHRKCARGMAGNGKYPGSSALWAIQHIPTSVCLGLVKKLNMLWSLWKMAS